MDVQAKTVVACRSKKGHEQIRTVSTMRDEVLELLDWLSKEGCTHGAIESRGVYWEPVFQPSRGGAERDFSQCAP